MSDPVDPSPRDQRQPHQDHPLAGSVLNIGQALLNVGSPAHRLGDDVLAGHRGAAADPQEQIDLTW